MPKLSKQFHLEITVEQFLCACSYLELQEINMRLDAHLRRKEPRPASDMSEDFQIVFQKNLPEIPRQPPSASDFP